MKAFSTITLLLVSLFLLIAGAAADTIQVQNVQVNTIGVTTPVAITLETASEGVAGYDITISLTDPSIASITSVSFPSWALLNESSSLPESSVRLRMVDLYKQVQPGATNVPFGSVTLRGDATGSTYVLVTIKEITSDDGDSLYPALQSGTFTVDSAGLAPIIADNSTTKLSRIPKAALDNARANLHIAYGHTSHGSQIVDGMSGLVDFTNAPHGGLTYTWNNGGTGDALDFRDDMGNYGNPYYGGAEDLGQPNLTAWPDSTRLYLQAHPEVNVIMWSWCGQVSGLSDAQLNFYLSSMNTLESEYPDVHFVYMTGHLDGSGESGTLNANNEKIRAYSRANNKILFDFADIESYDPDGLVNYMKLNANDNCDYDSNGDGSRDKNWATIWQTAHPDDWYNCGAAHSKPLNANQKAYAAWWLWARLGGWNGTPVVTDEPDKIGIVRNDNLWLLDASGNGAYGTGDRSSSFGKLGDKYIDGDWNGDGTSEIGVFRNGNQWLLDYNGNGVWDGASVDQYYSYGKTGDIPVAGDWDADGTSEIGVFRNGNQWLLDYNGNGVWNGASVDRYYNYGKTGDIPVAGDWDGDGTSEIGVFRNGNQWLLDYNGNGVWNGASVDRYYNYGKTGDIPVAGDWDGDGTSEIGVFRNGNQWLLDYNGNGVWDGASVDRYYSYGKTGDIPVIGKW